MVSVFLPLSCAAVMSAESRMTETKYHAVSSHTNKCPHISSTWEGTLALALGLGVPGFNMCFFKWRQKKWDADFAELIRMRVAEGRTEAHRGSGLRNACKVFGPLAAFATSMSLLWPLSNAIICLWCLMTGILPQPETRICVFNFAVQFSDLVSGLSFSIALYMWLG